MIIQPGRGIKRKITKLFEMPQSNVLAGATSYTCPYSGLALTFGGALSKDADGLYAGADYSTPTVVGTMPTMSGYLCVISLGKAATAAATPPIVTFGDASLTGATFSSSGNCNFDASPQITGRTNVALTTNAAATSELGVFDLVDATSPKGMYVRMNSTQIGSDFVYTTGSGVAFIATGVLNTIAFTALDSTAGRRQKYVAVIKFDELPSEQELIAAAFEMQETGTLSVNWTEHNEKTLRL